MNSKSVESMMIDISITEQQMVFKNRSIRLIFPVSTSKQGEGFKEGSNKTPLGMHEICEKIGKGAESGTVFRDRVKTERIAVINGEGNDLITSRILRLKGLQIRNANTYERYIYIHGTNDEKNIGKKASAGCIRMKNRDIIELFDHVKIGCKVYIRR